MTRNKKKMWKDIIEEWRGKGTIKGVRIEARAMGEYRLHYEDNGNPCFVDWNDKGEAYAALLEFGGKNDYTVRANDKFLKLNAWDSSALLDLGHSPTMIQLRGTHTVEKKETPITIPDGCGSPDKRIRTQKGEALSLHRSNKEKVGTTRLFKTATSFDTYLKFILKNTAFKGFEWEVIKLHTFAVETKQHCEWERKKSGDRSGMALKMTALGGKSVIECLPYDIVCAADDLIGGECHEITVIEAPPPKEETLCEIYAEGNVDPLTVKAVTPCN